jgi:hypothetical protein
MSRQVQSLLVQFPSLFVLVALAVLVRDFAKNPHPVQWARLIFGGRRAPAVTGAK